MQRTCVNLQIVDDQSRQKIADDWLKEVHSGLVLRHGVAENRFLRDLDKAEGVTSRGQYNICQWWNLELATR